jgi:diacylglycerol O-acyltransferase / wax synthase
MVLLRDKCSATATSGGASPLVTGSEVPIALRHPVGLRPEAATGAVAARRSWRDNRGLLVPAEEVATSGMQGGRDKASVDREPVGLERVTASDLMLIWPEKEGWPQYIGALLALDGRSLFDADGRFLIEPVRETIGRRLHLAPRFRQVLYWPRPGLGWPVWADAQSFDIAEHVRVHPVPPPGDERQLLLACETLRRRPLHRARPLWEMWFLTGLPGERVGSFMKMHHTIADGVAGVATLAAFFDPIPNPPQMSAPPWSPSPPPSTRQLFWDNLRRRRQELGRALSAVTQPIATARRLRRSWPAARELFAEGRAPRTSLNRRIGSDRRLAIIRGSLDVAKNIAHTHGATVNDVLMTTVAAGYADLFRSRGEPTEDVVLRAFVPVARHREQPGEARGNVDAGMLVPLPIGERDDIRRLEKIAADTAERKKKSRPPAGSMFRTLLLQRAFLRLMPRQRFMNAYVADVPGPPIPLYFAGAPLLEIFPIVPLTANISIGVGALSYARQFNLAVVADRELCRDVEVFVHGVRRSLAALEAESSPRSPRSRAP